MYLDLLPLLGGPDGMIRGPSHEAHASRASQGAPDWQLAGWINTDTAIAAGGLDVVTDHIERLTGHPAIGVCEFLISRTT